MKKWKPLSILCCGSGEELLPNSDVDVLIEAGLIIPSGSDMYHYFYALAPNHTLGEVQSYLMGNRDY
jgi:hypothetical protein